MQAAEKIRGELERFLLDPKVTVIVLSTGSSSYYLFGEVAAQGEYPLTRKTTVLEAVIRAGGFRQVERSGQIVESGDLSRILLFRTQADGVMATYPLNLAAYADTTTAGDTARAQNMMLRPGDQIYVPERTRIAYILGEVAAPGIVPLAENTTLIQAIAERGGELPTANLKKVWVVRTDNGKTDFRSFDIKKVLKRGDVTDNISLESGDVVYIPQSFIGSLSEFVALWSGTLMPMMSTYQQAWETFYTADRYDALRRSDFGNQQQEILFPDDNDQGGEDF
jgi:polysaccharide biosynthesis/export protein